MPTPPVNRDSSISQRTDGTRRPYSIEAEAIFRISVSTLPDFSGENPISCMSLNATTNIATRMRPRRTKGIPRFVSWAINPPATEPVSIATPVTTWPRPKTDSSSPVKPVALSASTSHASTAPEKNVNPRPISMETTAHCQNGAWIRQSSTYSRVDVASVTVPSRYEARRPTVSATTPVGTSKITMPAVKKASIKARRALDLPGPSLGKVHQVDLVALALGFTGQCPARRPRLVADRSLAAELLEVDGLQLVANQPIEPDEQLEKPLAIVV